MKKLFLALALMISVASFAQTDGKTYYFELATSGFVTNYGETGVNMDGGIFAFNPKWFPSLNADVYQSRVPNGIHWTTAQIGARLNVVVLKHLLLSAGPKYVTQGRELVNGYNTWVFDGAVSGIFLLAQRDDGVMWLKLSTQYNNTPQQRVFFIVGLQFALR